MKKFRKSEWKINFVKIRDEIWEGNNSTSYNLCLKNTFYGFDLWKKYTKFWTNSMNTNRTIKKKEKKKKTIAFVEI